MPTPTGRETAAERRAREQQEREAQQAAEWAEFCKDYHKKVLHLASQLSQSDWDFEVYVTDVRFKNYNTDEEYKLNINLPDQYSWEHVNAFNDVERLVETHKEQLAEESRQRELRKNALNKLTDEERQALGL